MKILGLICARGGSKGVPNKNRRPLKNRPLVAWSILSAKEQPMINDIVVTSDCSSILSIANQYGSETVKRPDDLATDDCTQFGAIKHAVATMQHRKRVKYDWIALLQPTVPFRKTDEVTKALEWVNTKDAAEYSCLLTMERVKKHPRAMYLMDRDTGKLKTLVNSDPKGTLRQDYEPVYFRNGMLYLFRAENLEIECKKLTVGSVYGSNIKPMLVSKYINIDTMDDWKKAEATK